MTQIRSLTTNLFAQI